MGFKRIECEVINPPKTDEERRNFNILYTKPMFEIIKRKIEELPEEFQKLAYDRLLESL